MGDVTFATQLTDLLRRLRPINDLLRSIYRALLPFVREVLRFSCRRFVRFGPPVGFYRLAEDLGARRIVGRIVVEAQEIPLSEAASVQLRTGWNLQKFYPWPIVWARISRARLVGPSLALMREDKRLAMESIWNEHCCRDDPSYNYLRLGPVTTLDGVWTSVLSRFCDGYYHWLMDALPRLALLREFPADTRILVPGNVTAYQRQSLELLNLADRFRPTPETHLRLEDYYFSSLTAMTGVSNPYAVNFLRKAFLPVEEPRRSPGTRLFIWRHGKTRGIRNQAQLADFLQKQDWTVVDLEKLSFREQIALFRGAKAICAAHGAALTNLVWCTPGTAVLEIFSHGFLNSCYEAIATLCKLDYRYIILPGDPGFRVTVPIKLIEEHLDWLQKPRAVTN
ncbi:MAG: glycosyltransferase family 61 protein [Verrucomicrobia bacterium]|nr:glycosyltransferase family 61 protein [Verrucomicrobiota bacterium]